MNLIINIYSWIRRKKREECLVGGVKARFCLHQHTNTPTTPIHTPERPPNPSENGGPLLGCANNFFFIFFFFSITKNIFVLRFLIRVFVYCWFFNAAGATGYCGEAMASSSCRTYAASRDSPTTDPSVPSSPWRWRWRARASQDSERVIHVPPLGWNLKTACLKGTVFGGFSFIYFFFPSKRQAIYIYINIHITIGQFLRSYTLVKHIK